MLPKFEQIYLNIITQSKNKTVDLATIEAIPGVQSDKHPFPKGVMVYKLQNSKQGFQALRKIVDLCYGTEAVPWDLVYRNGDTEENKRKTYKTWKQFCMFPRRVAFQNGKLIALAASKDKEFLWWDRLCKSHKFIPLLDGSEMDPQHPEG